MGIRPVPERLTDARIAECYAGGYWRDELVAQQLARQAQARPTATAVVDADRRATWAELHGLSQRLALHLHALGIGRGDAVALQLPNWLEYLIGYYGIQLAGGVVIQPGADWRSLDTEYALAISGAKATIIPGVFADHDFPAMIDELRPRLAGLEHVIVARGSREGDVALEELLADPIEERLPLERLEPCQPSPDDVVRIVFTSGTTGRPKAIMHTNNTVAHSSRTLISAFRHCADDVFLQYVPLSTNYGTIMGLHLHVTTGARIVLMDRFSATRALELIEDERVTFLAGTPTAFIALVNSPARRGRAVDSLRLLMSAGASFPVPSIKELRASFPTTFIDSFGMNEFGMGLWCATTDNPRDVDGSIGRPIPGLEARVVDAEGNEVAAGEIGELVIKSPGMCCGYHGDPEATTAAWDSEGWFYSGDLATQDGKGYFRVVGRAKDVIIRGGANVSPREVEEALSGHPYVREVSVIGLADAHYGEVVCACVIAQPDVPMSAEDVRSYLEPRIAAIKIPSRVFFMREFPLNSMGKVRKDVLRQRVLEGSG